MTPNYGQMKMGEPYDWDIYANAFLPAADALTAKAEIAEKNGENEVASELYL